MELIIDMRKQPQPQHEAAQHVSKAEKEGAGNNQRQPCKGQWQTAREEKEERQQGEEKKEEEEVVVVEEKEEELEVHILASPPKARGYGIITSTRFHFVVLTRFYLNLRMKPLRCALPDCA